MFETLTAFIEESGLDKDDDAVFEAWDALHPPVAGGEADVCPGTRPPGSTSVLETIAKMPYDFSPARLRCMELATELFTREPDAP